MDTPNCIHDRPADLCRLCPTTEEAEACGCDQSERLKAEVEKLTAARDTWAATALGFQHERDDFRNKAESWCEKEALTAIQRDDALRRLELVEATATRQGQHILDLMHNKTPRSVICQVANHVLHKTGGLGEGLYAGSEDFALMGRTVCERIDALLSERDALRARVAELQAAIGRVA